MWHLQKERNVTKHRRASQWEVSEDHQEERVFYLGPEGWASDHRAFTSESGHMPKLSCVDSYEKQEKGTFEESGKFLVLTGQEPLMWVKASEVAERPPREELAVWIWIHKMCVQDHAGKSISSKMCLVSVKISIARETGKSVRNTLTCGRHTGSLKQTKPDESWCGLLGLAQPEVFSQNLCWNDEVLPAPAAI